MKEWKQTLRLINADLSKVGGRGFKDFIKHYMFPKGEVFRYVFWMRMVQWAKERKVRKYTVGLLCYARLRHYEYKYGIHVNTNISIGGGLHIVHGDGVHLNCAAIGENVKVYQGVTVGAEWGGVPVIGNNVTIYTNAVVTGAITLNDGCTIGAQSFCNRTCPSDSLVAGVPASVVKKNGGELE